MEKSENNSELKNHLLGREILEQWKEIIPIKYVKKGSSKSNGVKPSKIDKEKEIRQKQEFFDGHDEEQIRFMDELCIVVDYNDVPIGAASKRICHLMSNIDRGLIHRAFSVLLFDKYDRLLLQKRAKKKITFPNLWTNTCCSHPHCTEEELGFSENDGYDEFCVGDDNIEKAVQGVIIAAKRKLKHELGIVVQDNLDSIFFLTRIYYKSESQSGNGNSVWGEHEIDYILVVRMKDDFSITPNFNEIDDYLFFGVDYLKAMIHSDEGIFTPWFILLYKKFLFDWWNSLNKIESFKDGQIHRL